MRLKWSEMPVLPCGTKKYHELHSIGILKMALWFRDSTAILLNITITFSFCPNSLFPEVCVLTSEG